MNMYYIPAIASFSGSASGTLASIVTGWVTRASQGPRASYAAGYVPARGALQELH